MNPGRTISVNRRAAELTAALRRDAAILNLGVESGPLGETLIDAGASRRGGVEAGLRIAEICMGGLGKVRLAPDQRNAALAMDDCGKLAAAGDSLSRQPIRGLAPGAWNWRGRLFCARLGPGSRPGEDRNRSDDIGYADEADSATLVIESGRPPPPEVVERVARDCRIDPSALTVIFARTQSLAGATQVVARVLEVALHKAHQLKFPLDRIVDGMGAAPLCPAAPRFRRRDGPHQ